MGLKALTQPACVCFGGLYDLLKRGEETAANVRAIL